MSEMMKVAVVVPDVEYETEVEYGITPILRVGGTVRSLKWSGHDGADGYVVGEIPKDRFEEFKAIATEMGFAWLVKS